MPLLSDLIARQVAGQAPHKAQEATIRSVPANQADPVYVSIDKDGPYRRGPCPWPARGELLPSIGDAALVLESDQGNFWVIGWWPQ